MFESYRKPDRSKLSGAKIAEDFKTFMALLAEQTEQRGKDRRTIFSNRNVGVYPQRWTGKSPTNGHYSISRGIRNIDPAVSDGLLRLVRPITLIYLDGDMFAVKTTGEWRLISLSQRGLGEIFPKGIPTTEKQLRRWISYAGYISKRNARSTCKKFNDGILERSALADSTRAYLESLGVSKQTTGHVVDHLVDYLLELRDGKDVPTWQKGLPREDE